MTSHADKQVSSLFLFIAVIPWLDLVRGKVEVYLTKLTSPDERNRNTAERKFSLK